MIVGPDGQPVKETLPAEPEQPTGDYPKWWDDINPQSKIPLFGHWFKVHKIANNGLILMYEEPGVKKREQYKQESASNGKEP